jgi:cytochrome c biogenesis protein CcmG/thiol:disulfide interchange protein DsbE
MNRRRMLMLAPLGLAVAGGGAFLAMLRGLSTGSFDPRGVPSPIVGQPVPEFTLASQVPGQGFSSTDLRNAGHVVMINFFASWCVPCALEHPALMGLKQTGLPIWAIAYKDAADKAAGFISRNGDPYARIGRDDTGRVSIDWGLSGVPESFLVDRAGVVQWHYAGPLTPEVIGQQLRPALARYA